MDCHILMVEDSDQIREAVYDFFVSESGGHFKIDMAEDGNKGLSLALTRDYDLVILDIMLPGASGFDICKTIRKKESSPIIFLTALGTEENILKGYALGGDEYVTKPFSLKVLYAKCLALLNRTMSNEKRPRECCGNIEIDTICMTVYSDGKEIELAPKEYFLLKTLVDNQGRVLSRNYLLDSVWGADYDGLDRVVDNHIKKLRRSLGESGKQIKTVFGTGYKMVGD